MRRPFQQSFVLHHLLKNYLLRQPDPEGISVAVILNAFSAPVGDFITKLNVPSPEPTILAVMS